ncbi:hypothetical protein AA101099_2187 [Neoasaia chiangmaiensis NBRC 101099]|uniref:Uncharacterized protein n=1 Tax=Neoasaia chiangmaiensis TaxID=320497 RepID=A0A1U9KSR0_9PROT|nr:hypothetical protein [Neoasaia chiangmaiensis]AQS88848.1 hypothetical protein A0U93_13990 [Neoasaia chiangmaiensis]GBR40594.1 hypothetical protein AA101099_2187 [Neoasaia chiangmaiensis NBRC 101099]GEN13825.1 hypothetical protein NCH01_02560 [Neoasaia chiangmaiensis]
MSEKLDPKELKILSDILALVLEDQPGQASNALEAIRNRARRNAMTGGALKNLFVAIAPNPPPRKPRARSTAGTANNTGDSAASRQRIMSLTEDLRRLDLDLRTSRARVEALRAELHQTQAARAEAQSQLYAARRIKRPVQMPMIFLACIVGALLGIAATQLVHSVIDVPRPDNSIYLR